MGNTHNTHNTEEIVKNYINEELKDDVDATFLQFFNDVTSRMNLNELRILKEVPNYDWVLNHWVNKANSQYNRNIINRIIDKKINKELERNRFGTKTIRKRRRSKDKF